jgi:anaerobic selenocysteine-containing dehydrogenase
MSEEMISRRDFLAGIGATLGLAAGVAIAVAPVTASASSAKAASLPAGAACSRCHVSAPCDEDCATCPENKKKPADK